MSAFTLKLIALVTMIIDHVGAIFFPQFIWLRYIGRLSMPIYAFLLVQGYMHTRNFNRYALRMGIFALLSEVPYDLLFQGTWLEFQRQNILFTFLTALFVMKLRCFREKPQYFHVHRRSDLDNPAVFPAFQLWCLRCFNGTLFLFVPEVPRY